MIKFFKNLFLTNYFFIVLAIIMILFIIAYIFPVFIFIPQLFLVAFIIVFLVDCLVLFNVNKGIETSRTLSEKLSVGDDNLVKITLKNFYRFQIKAEIIDEVPTQFQMRNTQFKLTVDPSKEKTIQYILHPTKRGEYIFKFINVYVQGFLHLIKRRFTFEANRKTQVYPSIIQMHKYEMLAFVTQNQELGIKKIRKVGQSDEFEQIKEYTIGNDIRTINWKATARKNQLMVNQFEDEKSHHIFNFIDKGRLMRSPFKNLTLLDYAINASLVLSNIIIKKQDKAGLLTFNNTVDNFLKPDNKLKQLKSILEILYNEKTNFLESNFDKVYAFTRRHVKRRSLLILYTNFNSIDGMKRQLSYLRMINKFHLLVIVFFKNADLEKQAMQSAKNIQEVYINTIAEKFGFEKRQIVKELNKNGIHTILTEPENLTINTINKYLEVKSRGLI